MACHYVMCLYLCNSPAGSHSTYIATALSPPRNILEWSPLVCIKFIVQLQFKKVDNSNLVARSIINDSKLSSSWTLQIRYSSRQTIKDKRATPPEFNPGCLLPFACKTQLYMWLNGERQTRKSTDTGWEDSLDNLSDTTGTRVHKRATSGLMETNQYLVRPWSKRGSQFIALK